MASGASRRRLLVPPAQDNEVATEAVPSADDGHEVSLEGAARGRSRATAPDADGSREDGASDKRQKTTDAGERPSSGSVHGQQVVGDVPKGAYSPRKRFRTQFARHRKQINTDPICALFWCRSCSAANWSGGCPQNGGEAHPHVS